MAKIATSYLHDQQDHSSRMPTPTWAPILKYVSGLEVRHLVTPQEITRAQKCLYQIYHIEQGWNPGPNPSGLRVVEDRLEDDLNVDWYGIFRDGKLVGVGRLMGELETTRYLSKDDAKRLLHSVNPNGQLRVCENNRTAIVPEVRGGLASACLWLAGVYFSGMRGYDISVGAVNPKLASVYEQRFGFQRTGLCMKYNQSDPMETEICFSRVGFSGLFDQLTAYASWRVRRVLFRTSGSKSTKTHIWYGE